MERDPESEGNRQNDSGGSSGIERRGGSFERAGQARRALQRLRAGQQLVDVLYECSEIVRASTLADVVVLRAGGQVGRAGREDISGESVLLALGERALSTGEHRWSVIPGETSGPRAIALGELVALPLDHDALQPGSVLVLGFEPGRAPTGEAALAALRAVADEVSWALAYAVLQAEVARLAAERAQRSAAPAVRERDQLLSFMAHELRTPLTPMMILLQSLERKARMGQVDPEGIARTRRQALRLARLIGDLVDLARHLEGRLELDRAPMDLVELAVDTANLVRPSLHKHALEVVASVPDLPVLADRVRLERVVQNLLEQVERLVPNRGTLRIAVDGLPGEARLTFSAAGEAATAPEQLARVAPNGTFANLRGLNLGMYLSEVTVDLHGGKIEVAPRPGMLSEVVVSLPRPPSPG